MNLQMIILVTILSCFTLCRSEDLPCDTQLTVDITDGENIGDIIVKDGVSYNDSTYYVIDGIVKGCICDVMECVYKCCPFGYHMHNKSSCGPTMVDNTAELYNYVNRQLNLSRLHIIHKPIDCMGEDIFRFIIDTGPNGVRPVVIDNLEGFEDDRDNFCVDYFADDQVFAGIVCVEGSGNLKLHSIGMIISMPFLLATFLVYSILPERNLPAKALMCYVLSLLFAYIMLVTIQLANDLANVPCTVLAYLCYFFFMVSFFWMNSSCIDIWLTFSGMKGMTGQRTHERKRFMYYSMYSWGVPLIMVCIVIWANTSEIIPQSLRPLIGFGQCWFGNQLQTGVYFYFPIAFLVGSNIVLFAITAIKIIRVQRDTKMLNCKDSTKHENDKQRFNLYVKLLFAMGVNWSMEIISWSVEWRFPTSASWIWYLTDFCNAMYGVLIFFIFVFKKNIWVILKKRYLQFTGKPQQAHRYGLSSTHRTTVSQVTSTSEA